MQSTNGFGDPTLEFTLNVVGPKAQKNIPDILRYEPGFSVDLLVDLALPIGEYDSSQPLNIGQNRWYGRVGAPIIWQPRAVDTGQAHDPGIPACGVALRRQRRLCRADPGNRSDVPAGCTLTRDFTQNMWSSLDFTAYRGGEATINGTKGEELDNTGMGFRLGYVLNNNLNLTFGYKSTINDEAPDALRMDSFMITLVFGWHPLVEGMRRLEGEK